MVIATHVVKIRGTLDRKIWKDEKEIKNYINDKMKGEIDPSFHSALELFKIDGDEIDVWIFIHAFPSEVERDIIDKWIKDHIKEKGITVNNFEFEKIFDMTDDESWRNKPFINIP